jgi:hypothetical protein
MKVTSFNKRKPVYKAAPEILYFTSKREDWG